MTSHRSCQSLRTRPWHFQRRAARILRLQRSSSPSRAGEGEKRGAKKGGYTNLYLHFRVCRSFGALPDDARMNMTNRAAINAAFAAAASGDEVIVPAGLTFHATGGLVLSNRSNVSVTIAGTLVATADFNNWSGDVSKPKDPAYDDFLTFQGCDNLRVSGAGTGIIDGQGAVWWDRFLFGNIKGKRSRPILVMVYDSRNVVVEKIKLMNSPHFNLFLEDVADAEVGFVTVETDRFAQRNAKSTAMKQQLKSMGLTSVLLHAALEVADKIYGESGSWLDALEGLLMGAAGSAETALWGLQMEDLNTDGIDVAGQNIWVHDCNITNDDDSVAVKPSNRKHKNAPCTQNVLVERTTLHGFGASIGSVPPSPDLNCVRNVTFRNIEVSFVLPPLSPFSSLFFFLVGRKKGIIKANAR